MSLGSRIRKVRKLRGYTQKQMAEKLNMTEANFSSYERDKSIPPSEKLNELATILGVRTDYLHGRTDEMDLNDPYSLTPKEDHDIAKDLERIMKNLESESALAFQGEPMDEETKRLLQISLENSMRLAKEMAKKKFDPRKNRK